MSGADADEEAGQDGLADVHGVELLPQGRVGQPGPDGDADGRLVQPDDLGGGRRVSGPEAGDEVGQRTLYLGHRRTLGEADGRGENFRRCWRHHIANPPLGWIEPARGVRGSPSGLRPAAVGPGRGKESFFWTHIPRHRATPPGPGARPGPTYHILPTLQKRNPPATSVRRRPSGLNHPSRDFSSAFVGPRRFLFRGAIEHVEPCTGGRDRHVGRQRVADFLALTRALERRVHEIPQFEELPPVLVELFVLPGARVGRELGQVD